MYLLRISFYLCMLVCIALTSSCASMGGLQGSDNWSVVPKSYIAGLTAARDGQPKQAIKLFTSTISAHPDFSPAYVNLGLQQLKLKQYEVAERSFKKSIEINPDNPVSFHYLGVISRFKGDFNTAKTRYLKAIDLNPDYAEAHLNLGILQDLYLYELEQALEHYETYQSLLKKKDGKISKWIIDIKRRIAKSKKS
jgi:tetratricopeptide (TPR) repeat protein